MNRLWAAGGILLLLIALCFSGSRTTFSMTEDMTSALEQLQAAAAAEDSEKAMLLCRRAQEQWQGWREKMAVYVSHSDLEDVDRALAGLPALIQAEASGSVLLETQRAITMIFHLKESERLIVQNIL